MPSGRAALDQVRKALARGWPDGLAVLTGEDLYHLDRAFGEVRDALAPPGTDFGATVFTGDPVVGAAAVVGAAKSISMFSPRIVVLVRDPAALGNEPEPLLAYASSPPGGSHLVVRAPKLDRKRKMGKALAAAPHVFAFEPPQAAEVAAVAREMAREKQLALEPRALELLAEATAGDFLRLSSEMDKLKAWAGESAKPLALEQVRQVASGEGALSDWAVVEGFKARNAKAALAAARFLLDGGVEPLKMLGGLAWQARTLLQARALKDSGNVKEAIAAARAWSDPKLLDRYTLAELRAMPARLLQADRKLKGSALDRRAVVEDLLRDLIERKG